MCFGDIKGLLKCNLCSVILLDIAQCITKQELMVTNFVGRLEMLYRFELDDPFNLVCVKTMLLCYVDFVVK